MFQLEHSAQNVQRKPLYIQLQIASMFQPEHTATMFQLEHLYIPMFQPHSPPRRAPPRLLGQCGAPLRIVQVSQAKP
jgi:hypothetical protein